MLAQSSVPPRHDRAYPSAIARIGEGAVCGLALVEIPNPPDLNCLRNVIGLTTYLLDHGGFAARGMA